MKVSFVPVIAIISIQSVLSQFPTGFQTPLNNNPLELATNVGAQGSNPLPVAGQIVSEGINAALKPAQVIAQGLNTATSPSNILGSNGQQAINPASLAAQQVANVAPSTGQAGPIVTEGINAVLQPTQVIAQGLNPPTSASSTVGSGVQQVIDVASLATQQAANVASSVAQAGQQAINSGISAGLSVANTVGDITSGIVSSLANASNPLSAGGLLQQLQSLANTFAGNFNAIFTQFQNLTSGILPVEFDSILKSMRQFLDNLQLQVNDFLRLAIEAVQTTIRTNVEIFLNQTSALGIWAAEVRNRLTSAEKKAKAEPKIQEFVDRSNDKIQKCANDTTKSIQEVYDYSRGFVNEATELANQVVNGGEICFAGRELIFLRMTKCGTSVATTVFQATNLFNRRIAPIQSRLMALGVTSFVDWTCIITSRLSIEVDKLIVQTEVATMS